MLMCTENENGMGGVPQAQEYELMTSHFVDALESGQIKNDTLFVERSTPRHLHVF